MADSVHSLVQNALKKSMIALVKAAVPHGGVLPLAHLAIESYASNPPRPGGISVMLDDTVIATVTLEQFKEISARLSIMEAVYEDSQRARGR